MNTLYLNNSGDKWVILPKKVHHKFVLVLPDGLRLMRTSVTMYLMHASNPRYYDNETTINYK